MSSLPFLFFSFFTCLFSFFFAPHAFNITKILDQQGSFRTFNGLLSQTQLSSAINSRQTITVLVVSDDNISHLSTQPLPVINKILSLHVVLEYYDTQRLKNLPKRSALLTTLFQTTGQAKGQQGFLNVTVVKNGDVTFGSAVPGSTLGASLVKPLVLQPYNLSVLQISGVIMMDVDTEAPTTFPPAPPTGSPKMAPSPKEISPPAPPTPKEISPSAPPTGSPKKAPSPENASTMSPPAPAESPEEASSPTADGPADAFSDHTSAPNKVSQINPQLAAAFLPLFVIGRFFFN